MREFHHGPEPKRSIYEAEDTDAVDLPFNLIRPASHAEYYRRRSNTGELCLLDRGVQIRRHGEHEGTRSYLLILRDLRVFVLKKMSELDELQM